MSTAPRHIVLITASAASVLFSLLLPTGGLGQGSQNDDSLEKGRIKGQTMSTPADTAGDIKGTETMKETDRETEAVIYEAVAGIYTMQSSLSAGRPVVTVAPVSVIK